MTPKRSQNKPAIYLRKSSNDERRRNTIGPALAYAHDMSQSGALESPFPGRFPDLKPARSVELKIGGYSAQLKPAPSRDGDERTPPRNGLTPFPGRRFRGVKNALSERA